MATIQTANGAISHATTRSATVDLFFVCRGVPEQRLSNLVAAAWAQDPLNTLRLIAYIRDVRGGKGERDIGRNLLHWLASHNEETQNNLMVNIQEFIEFGRYDDIFALMETPLEKFAIDFLASVLKADKIAVSPSLAAKWIPSENKSLDRDHAICKKLANALGVSKAQLRKQYLAPLRKKLDLLETKLCNKDWQEINFEKVPSRAMHIHGKEGNAFPRHCEHFDAYKESLKNGEAKVNATVLFPHEIVHSYKDRYEEDPLLEAQWATQLKKLDDLNLDRCLVLSDVSASMLSGTASVPPMTISLTLGIMISELTKGPFHNHVLTFEEAPQFFHLRDESLYKRINCLSKAPWGGSTNLMLAFDRILRKAQTHSIPEEKMPTRIIIVSDMQFNAADRNYYSNYESIRQRYESAGYKLPQICFWNVNGSIRDYPVQASTRNVSLVSGFSIDILRCVLEDKAVSPETTMLAAIESPRYNKIKYIPQKNEEVKREAEEPEGACIIH
jgi:hypothetical protein